MREKKFTNKDVIYYYQTSQWLYRLFCYNPDSLGMHFGFWDKKTKNRQQAVSRENDYLIKSAGIKKGMKVLDAGCGVGGTALHIAQKTGANIWGITITPMQVQQAKQYAKKKGLEKLVTFSVQDYTKTRFPNKYFDAVVGIESVCYASPKSTFLKEAYRMLKPGGKIVVADGYLGRQPKNKKERDMVEDFKWAFAMNEFVNGDEMAQQMKQSGFERIKIQDMRQEIGPSVRHYQKLSNIMKVFCVAAKYIPIGYIQAIYKNYTALRISAEGYQTGLAAYYIHSAEKPKQKI